MNVLVTGHLGYLGGHVVAELMTRGHAVVGVDAEWYSESPSDDARSLDNFWPTSNPRFDAIVHLAWLSSAGDEFSSLQDLSVHATECLLRTFRSITGSPGRHIFASTVAVYGDATVCDEADLNPVGACAYSRTKARGEQLVRTMFPDHTIFRFGSLMGVGLTRTKTDVVVNSMAVDAWRRGMITLWHPDAVKPILHVADAARLIACAVEGGDEFCGTFNAAAESLPAIAIAQLVAADVRDAEIRIVDAPEGVRSRSYSMLCSDRLLDVADEPTLGIPAVVEEFRFYNSTPFDKNLPWLRELKRVRAISESSLVPEF